MKARLYTILTGLLMAACITSYGQEIVSQFTIQKPDRGFKGCDVMVNEDGTLLIGAISSTSPYFYDPEYVIYKTTSDGDAIDSLIFYTPNGLNGPNFTSSSDLYDKHFLFRNNTATDSYIITLHYRDMADNHYFRMILIDAELNINDDISVQVDLDANEDFVWDRWLLDPKNDFIVSFWTGDEFHIKRISLNGTIINALETTALFPQQIDYGYNPDTTLWYSGFGILNSNPLTYYKLGGYQSLSDTYPVYGYFFDEDFNMIGTHWYESNEDILFNGGNLEHIVPIDENSYLMVSEMEYPNNEAGVALIKYDFNHNPTCISPELGNSSYPLETKIAYDNTIYQLYLNFGSKWKVFLACMTNELDLAWTIELPGLGFDGLIGNSITFKPNGDIVVGFGLSHSYDEGSGIIVYTIRNTPANTTEKVDCNSFFSFYPNPVIDQLTLRFDDGVKPESVELYDLTGRWVSTKRNGLKNIDLNAISSGVYMLRITTTDGKTYRERVIKE